MMKQHLLLLEDEPLLSEMLRRFLQGAGFEVTLARTAPDALKCLADEELDMAILDIMVPEGDGLEILRTVGHRLPVIMISAKRSEVDRVLGLEMGADDYLPKPFSARELLARVKGVLRRYEEQQLSEVPRLSNNTVTCDGLVLDLEMRVLAKGSFRLHLTPIEFELARKLLQYPGRTFTRAELHPELSGSRAVDNHITSLRSKLRKLGPGLPRIESVRGLGYRIVSVG